ncbi:MAG: hypothetical protein VW931_07140, partial [Alphaproteobacteria bacterium]
RDLLVAEDRAEGEGAPARIEVLNKIDLLSAVEYEAAVERAARSPEIVALSAVSWEGCDHLLEAIDATLATADSVAEVGVDLSDGATIAWLYQRGEVLSRRDEGMQAHMTVRLAPRDLARFTKKQEMDTPGE